MLNTYRACASLGVIAISKTAPSIRVGIGYDIHRLAEGRRLVLAGVEVPHSMGAVAHSDGDVVLHAVADAILGAAGLGDLGEHFPDTDPAWKDADSADILDRVYHMIKTAGWRVVNVDVNVLLEKPKLVTLKRQMRARLHELLWTEAPTDVSIKARTMEGLGPIGEGRAVAAQAVVLLMQS
jgi:2-C-methyl-D-erythritol 2,4-cyclodiphosphate synthase